MRLLSAILFLSLSGLGGKVALADEVKPADTQPEATRHNIPLRIVKMLPDTQQALLFDKSQDTHIVADSGATIAGFLIDSIDEDTVTLIAEDGTEIVLAAPPKKKKAPKGSEPAPTVAATAPAGAAPADPYAAAPADPYAAPASSAPASSAAPPSGAAPADPYAATRPPAATAPAVAPAGTAQAVATTAPPAPGTAVTARTPAVPTSVAAPATAPVTATPAPGPAPAPAPALPPPTTTTSTGAAASAPTVAASPGAPAAVVTATAPAPADSAYPTADESELDPGIAAFVEAVGATPAPATAPASKALSATPIVAALRRTEVDAALGDFGALSASFRATFTPTGLRIDAVMPGSLLAKAGFAVGDVITIVDGKPLRTIDDAADLYARAWTTSSSTVQVIRAKQPLTMRIAIQ